MSELPADIAAAIEALDSYYDGVPRGEGGDYEATRAALTTAILSRLTAAEAARDEALKELEIAWLTHSAAVLFREERDAALFRAERAEKALTFYADEQNYRMNGPLDPNSSWFEGCDRARAAIIQPAPTEEGKP